MTLTDAPLAARRALLDATGLNQRRLEVAGAVTSVLEGGAGPPLVLLHGAIPAGGLVWWRVAARLADRFRLVVPDLPGVGESEPARPDATVGGWLDALIEATCREAPTLVAHSAPGGLAARFATERGDRLRRLLLVDAAGLGPFRPSPRLLPALARSMRRPGERSFEGLMARVMHDPDRVRRDAGGHWEAFARYAGARAAVPAVGRAMRELPRHGTRRVPADHLRAMTVPTSLVWGRHDPLIGVSTAEAASRRFGWPLQVIDASGHLPHVEQPDAFVDAVLGDVVS